MRVFTKNQENGSFLSGTNYIGGKGFNEVLQTFG
jgi:hypothetical protein